MAATANGEDALLVCVADGQCDRSGLTSVWSAGTAAGLLEPRCLNPMSRCMKVFISSLITGMETVRAAARAAVTVLGHDAVMAEDFGALPRSPQVACLDGVRRSAVTVLVLGPRYGAKQASGLSATHEEYREARGRCPVLAFVQEGTTAEPDQAAFVREVEAWTNGLIRVGFVDPADLQAKVTRALHRQELSSATAPFDANEVLARAIASFPEDERRSYSGGVLVVTVAGGPGQTVLRPSRMEEPSLAEEMEREALFGGSRVFVRGSGTKTDIVEGRLVLEQDGRVERSLQLDAQGTISIRQSLGDDQDRMGGMSVILVETVQERLTAALRYSAWLLDQLDPTQRLSHVVVVASITGGMAMRTRREHAASPGSYQLSGYGNDKRPPVHLTPPQLPRPALLQQADQIVEDLATLLRRQWR